MKENNLDDVSYNEFFSLCEKAYNRYGDILDLPVGVHPYDYIKNHISTRGKEGVRVLDFGCGAQTPLKQWCELSDEHYSTCDDDPGGTFTYRAVDQIPEDEKFDVISSSHVFEHIPFEAAISIGAQLAKHLKPDGIFLIAVPNPKHPTRYLSSPVHVTPWNYLNLYALHEMAGLDAFHCSRYNKFPRPPFYIYPLVHMMCRYFMMDWADSLYVVGRRES